MGATRPILSAFPSGCKHSKAFALATTGFLCTLRLARNLLPECGSFKLESLRHCLDLNAHLDGRAAHRAANDVAATCLLLARLIERYLSGGYPDDLDAFAAWSQIQRMPFGKHRGEFLSDLPPDYIDWLLGQEIDSDLRLALQAARESIPVDGHS